MSLFSAKALPLTFMLVESATTLFDEFGVGIAVVLTIVGVLMQAQLPRQRMSMEERMKDGKLTEEAAQRRLRFYGWCAPLVTLLGLAVLLAVLAGLMK